MEIFHITIILAILIIIHHILIHPKLLFPDRIFQIKDVLNHETWILVILSFGVGTLF